MNYRYKQPNIHITYNCQPSTSLVQREYTKNNLHRNTSLVRSPQRRENLIINNILSRHQKSKCDISPLHNTIQTFDRTQKTEFLRDQQTKIVELNKSMNMKNSMEDSFIFSLTDRNISTQSFNTLKNRPEKHTRKIDFENGSLGQKKELISNKKQNPTYVELIKENQQLKRVIQKQYLPMKREIDRLYKQQQQRDYLVTQLEWKVKQLAKQILQEKKNY